MEYVLRIHVQSLSSLSFVGRKHGCTYGTFEKGTTV